MPSNLMEDGSEPTGISSMFVNGWRYVISTARSLPARLRWTSRSGSRRRRREKNRANGRHCGHFEQLVFASREPFPLWIGPECSVLKLM